MFESVKTMVNGFWSNQDVENQNRSSYAGVLSYAQTLLKGVGLVTVGGMAYTFLRQLTTPETLTNTAKDSLAISKKTTSLVKPTDALSSQDEFSQAQVIESFSLQEATGIEINYRPKNVVAEQIFHLSENKKRNIGVEFQLNQNTKNTQAGIVVAALPNNRFVGVWHSNHNITSGTDVYARIFNEEGVPQTDDILVNTYTLNDQQLPSVAVSNASIGIVWQSLGQDSPGWGIYFQLLNLVGNKVGVEQHVNTYTFGAGQRYPKIACLRDQSFTVVWDDTASAAHDGSDAGVFFQQLDTNGNKVGAERVATTVTSAYQEGSSISSLGEGFIISWASYGSYGTTYAQLFDKFGNKINSQFQVNTYTANTNFNTLSFVKELLNGNFIITWSSEGQESSGYGVYAQLFNPSANKIGSEFQVSTYTLSNQWYSKIEDLANDAFLIVWQSDGQSPGDEVDNGYGSIYGQMFDASGQKIGLEFPIDIYQDGHQVYPSVARLTNNNIIVSWWGTDRIGINFDIFGRVLVPDEGLFALNINEPRRYLEGSIYQFSDFIVNPLLGASDVSVTLMLNSTFGQLIANPVRNIVSTFNTTTGTWQASGNLLDINTMLMFELQFVPALNVISPINITALLSDGIHSDYQTTLNLQGIPITKILHNTLTLSQGANVILSSADLLARGENFSTELIFTVSSISHGQFEYINNVGVAITSFTQQDINDSKVRFVHDGSTIQPLYQLQAKVNGGLQQTPLNLANISFNLKPILVTNILNIESGQTVSLSKAYLQGIDVDNDWNTLTFMITNAVHGQFEYVSNPGTAIITFTQQDVNDGKVQFAHDGSETAPSYQVSVSDGVTATQPEAPTINFVNLNLLSAKSEQRIIGAIVGAAGGALLLGVAGFFGWRYKKAADNANARMQYPLGSALYDELKINGTEDFKSEKGIAFTNAVDALKNELKRAGIDVDQLVPEEITQLAQKLGKAIKAQVEYQVDCTGVKLNPTDIQDDAFAIVDMTKMLKNDLKQEQDEVEMGLIKR